MVWGWFSYVLIANVLLVIPLLWLAAFWSLQPIKALATQVRELEKGQRDSLSENPLMSCAVWCATSTSC